MTGLHLRSTITCLAVVLCIALLAVPVAACPFCGVSGKTLTQEMDEAAMVAFGTLKNARLSNPGGEGFPTGETDLVLDKENGIIKPHPFLEGKTVITLPKYLPDKGDGKFLVFIDIFRKKLDPYRGMPIKAETDMPKYLKGAYASRKDKMSERLKFFFNYLQNEDLAIANDALFEFGNASYEDVRDMVHAVPAERIAGWLRDRHTPSYRIGLFASMLGHATTNKDEYADLLRSLVKDPDNRVAAGIDGVLAGQVLLQPKEGWEFLRAALGNRKNDFNYRYAALKASRFFLDNRKDLIPRDRVIENVSQMLEHGDMADLAIEDLRRWKAWELTNRILELRKRPSHDVAIMRRAILRFAIQSDRPEAKKYVEAIRADDPDLVERQEEILKTEKNIPPAPSRSPGSN